MRKEKWNAKYDENCIVMWDDTNLLGRLGVEELWVGATSDTYYQEKTGIFKQQGLFSQNSSVNNKHLPFTDIFDKGYCSWLTVWRCGRQLTIQPDFAKSDTKFCGLQTIKSASAATDRSGNECAVNLCKSSMILQSGLKKAGDMKQLNEVWLAWSF
eukprot:9114858-Ditylum_brightwellii.AAC.1